MKLLTMTVGEWAKVPNNPIQRDTVRHAAKAVKQHLSAYSPVHASVSAAMVHGVGLIKLDGHTRSYLWASGQLIAPKDVLVSVYEVDSMAMAIALYKQFDSPEQTETAKDKLTGAYSLNGIYAKSSALNRGGITSAFQIIYGGKIDIYECCKRFRSALIAIDAENFSDKKMVSPLLAAALLGYERRGAAALNYFQKYQKNEGIKSGVVRDCVEALSATMALRKASGRIGGGSNHQQIAAIALNGMERHLAGMDKVRGELKGLDLRAYIKEVI